MKRSTATSPSPWTAATPSPSPPARPTPPHRDPQGDDVFVDGENVTVALEDAAATDGSAFENVTRASRRDHGHRHYRHRHRHPECRQ
ncbi:hypothetical protein FDY98_22280 (plasmid) [Halomonas sp. PA16-9]|nr:hypothetical protein FDY98_22280 [Halomonas sp. PA16-9]